MTTIYVTKTTRFKASQSELDFENREKFGWEDHDKHDFVEIETNPLTDAEPIEIDQLIAILNKAKSVGSTHVAIEYHCDHIGYDITGIEMRLSTEDEVLAYTEKKKAEQEKRRKLHDLRAQIAKIENE